MLVIKQLLLRKQFNSEIIILTYIDVSTRGEVPRSNGGSNELRRHQNRKEEEDEEEEATTAFVTQLNGFSWL